MLDINRIRLDGEINHQSGLHFFFYKNRRAVAFLVKTIWLKRQPLHIRMEPDVNHGRPHVHIDQHAASFAIDNGELLAGECDQRTCGYVQRWIRHHRNDLLSIWDLARKGGDYQSHITAIERDKSFEEMGFNGREPRKVTNIGEMRIWHNKDLVQERDQNGVLKISSKEDMYVAMPAGFDDSTIFFDSQGGNVHIKRF